MLALTPEHGFWVLVMIALLINVHPLKRVRRTRKTSFKKNR